MGGGCWLQGRSGSPGEEQPDLGPFLQSWGFLGYKGGRGICSKLPKGAESTPIFASPQSKFSFTSSQLLKLFPSLYEL